MQDAVWFTAPAAGGPWAVATSVPSVIYTIPPSSPLHYVTYVRIYETKPDPVYVGYTPRLLRQRASRTAPSSTAPATTTRPTWARVWYGPPVTYGSGVGMTYTPWTGWTYGFGFGWSWGAVDRGLGLGRLSRGGARWAGATTTRIPTTARRTGAAARPGARGAAAPSGGPAAGRPRRGNVYSRWGATSAVTRRSGGYNAWTGNAWRNSAGMSYNSRTGNLSAGQRSAVGNVYTGNYAYGGRGGQRQHARRRLA